MGACVYHAWHRDPPIAIGRLQRHTDYRFAVLYINLRRFRLINESLGYERGDLVLQASGLGLKAAIRPADVAARIAGDEFAILLDGLASLTDATRVAERILDCDLESGEQRGNCLFVDLRERHDIRQPHAFVHGVRSHGHGPALDHFGGNGR